MSAARYVWVRWRTRSSSGPGAWTYVEYWTKAETPDEIIREFDETYIEELSDAQVPRWSEHHRGVDSEVVPVGEVPTGILELDFKIALNVAEDAVARAKRRQQVLDERRKQGG